MKKSFLAILWSLLLLPSCNGWVIQPGPFNPPTPFLPPTHTPSIVTATSVVAASLTPVVQLPTAQVPTWTPIPFITATTAPTLILSDTPINVPTTQVAGLSLSVEILGCNTSIDLTHGMGEVTNSFVVLRNVGGTEFINLNTTLKALDEGREHPDKTVEVPSLMPGYQVTLKLTVDSTFQEQTPIQVEVTADGGFFQRLGADSCRDIGVLEPNPGDLNTPMPNNP